MNVLFLSHRLPYAPNRGDRVRAFHLLKEMARWASVDLVSLVHDEDEASHAGDLRSIVRSVHVVRVPRVLNLARTLAALPTHTPATHTMLAAPSMPSVIARVTGEARPDVVLSYCTGVAPVALRAPLDRTPLVLDMVDVDSAKWATLGDKSGGPRGWIYRREATRLRAFEAMVAARAAATLVVNAKEQETLSAIAPGARIHVVENGVDLDAMRPANGPSDVPVVVFCGVMNYAPNVEGALWLVNDVWPHVRRARPDARLEIVGSDPTSAVKALESTQGVTVTGRVPDVRPYLWRAAVSAAPLHTARGIQNKVLEAVAAGLPTVVTSAVWEGLPDQVHPACVAADSPEAFARELLGRLAGSGADRRALASSADLGALAWDRRLTGLRSIVTAAAGLQGRTKMPN